MLIADVENPNKKHYVAVKSLLRLLSKQNSKHKEAQHFCTNCLNGFESEIEMSIMNIVDQKTQLE